MTRATLLHLAALAATAAAATADGPASTLLSVPFWGYDAPASGLAGSVVAVGSDATTLSLNCIGLPPGSDGCGLFPYQTLVYGAASYRMDMSDTAFTATEECAFDRAQITAHASAVTAVCTQSISGSSANDPGSDVGTLTDGTVWPVTITAGLGLLVAPGPTATTTTASTTGSESHSSPTGATTGAGVSSTGAATTGGTSGTHSGTNTASAASTSSTSTGPAVRAYAPLGGMGMALGAAAGYLYA